MSWNADEGQQIGRMEGTLNTIAKRIATQEPRIAALEGWSNRVKGALKIATVLIGLGATLAAAVVMSGCTHFVLEEYAIDSGNLVKKVAVTVVGTGDVNVLTEGTDVLYESSGTGLSDNSVKLVEKAVEAGVKAAIPLPVN